MHSTQLFMSWFQEISMEQGLQDVTIIVTMRILGEISKKVSQAVNPEPPNRIDITRPTARSCGVSFCYPRTV